MKNLFKTFFGLVAIWCVAIPVRASESAPVNSGQTIAQIVTSHDRAAPGSDIFIALSLRLETHWHTYWRNAGGPGKPATITWTLPEGVSVGDMHWPLPKIVHTGPIVNYVFEDRLLLPMSLHVPNTAIAGETIEIRAEAFYLVCYQVCIPESADLSVSFEIGKPILDGRWDANIKRALINTPKAHPEFKAVSYKKGKSIGLDILAPDLAVGKIKNPYFFPFVQDMIDADAAQTFIQFERGVRLSLKPGWKLEDGLTDGLVGVIAYDAKTDEGWHRRGVEITAKTGKNFDLGPSLDPNPNTAFSWSWASLMAALLIGLGLGAIIVRSRNK